MVTFFYSSSEVRTELGRSNLLIATVWSVNDGLSGNLWKPSKSGRGGFRQVSEFFISIIFFSERNLLIEKSGNLPERIYKGRIDGDSYYTM